MKSHLNRLLLSTLVLVLFLSLFGLETVRVQGQIIESPTEDQRLINYFEPVDLSMDTFEEEVFLTQYNVDIHPSSLDSVAAASREVHRFQNQLRGYYTNYELLTKLSRWVAGRFEYDEDYWLTGMSDALVASKGVCWHYAYLFDYLAKSYGFTSQVMYGYIDGEAHVVNRVLYGGNWKYFDLVAGCYWLDKEQIEDVLGYQESPSQKLV